jgi:DNA-binding NarL/FixJ family response regulator
MPERAPVRIIIADDKQIYRFGLRELLRGIERCEVVAEAHDGLQAVDLAIRLQPDLVFLKSDIAELNGVTVTQKIKKNNQNISVLMLLSKEQDFWAALDSEADGYVVREMMTEVLPMVITVLTEGGAFIGPTISAYLLRGEGLRLLKSTVTRQPDASALAALSLREKDVLNLLVEGMSNQQIADRLGLSIQTVKVHVRHILRKLRVEDRTQAVLKVLKPASRA